MNEIITIKQLPIIEEHLKQIRQHMAVESEKALSLECNAQTLKDIKKVRATLSADFKKLEEKRKEVKAQVLAPYEEFEAIYKECVTDIYKHTDNALKSRISEVENKQLEKKRADAVEYFEEYKIHTGIDFIAFDDVPVKINVSTSLKKIKEQCKQFIDNIQEDINLINTYMDAAEIFYEYKKTFNVSNSIAIVMDRKRVIEEREEEQEQIEQQKQLLIETNGI